MAVKYALLALLAEGPRHGYQLKAEFDAATGAGWPLNIGQVYTTLRRLERDELVMTDGPPDESGRQAYALLAAGHVALATWLDEPIASPAPNRDEVTMKILIAVKTGVRPALTLIRDQRVAAMEHLQALTAQKIAVADGDLAQRLHLDRISLLAESEIRWLDLAEQRLESSGEAHLIADVTRRSTTPQTPKDSTP